MATVAVIDHGMGNLRSVARALAHVAPHQRVTITQSPREIDRADRVVFPGQGAIRACMAELERLELVPAVTRAARERPFLGLCLGPQALMERSEEDGGVACLGLLPGRVRPLAAALAAAGAAAKVPHMGWNGVHQTIAHPLWAGIPQDRRFYFVHSYYLEPAEASLVAGRTTYRVEFASAVARDGLFAVQFHPEKSGRDGLRLLANFSQWKP